MAHERLVEDECLVGVGFDNDCIEGEEHGTGCEVGVEHAYKDLVEGEGHVAECLGHEEQENAGR